MASSERLTTARALMRRLEQRGVEMVFGIPGTHNLPLFEALHECPGLRLVPMRHEQGAGYAADAVARATGRPAVCLATTGPGITNAATAIATARADSVPMIVIAPGPPSAVDGHDTGYLHEARDQFGAISALSGGSERVRDAAQAIAAIDRAMLGFAAGRPRPFYIETPVDLLDAESVFAAGEPPSVDARLPDARSVRAAAELLDCGESITLVLGGGAVDAGREATALAERLQALVVTTVNGKGTVAEDHALSLGASIRLPEAQRIVGDSDVVLAVGTELAESDLWHDPPLVTAGALIRIDIDPGQAQKNAQAQAVVIADAAAALQALAEATDGRGRPAVGDRAAMARARLVDEAAKDGAVFRGLVGILDAALAADAILVNDSAQVCYYGAAHFLPARRSRSFLYPTGYATLGYAIPAAIGAKLAVPERQVVALLGDGGALFSIAEIGAGVAAGASVPIVVVDNGGYGEIRREMEERGMPSIGVDFDPGRLSDVAIALGAAGRVIEDLTELPTALADAFERPGPTLIEIPARAL